MQRAQGLRAVLCAVSEARQIWKVPACPASEPGGHLCDLCQLPDAQCPFDLRLLRWLPGLACAVCKRFGP